MKKLTALLLLLLLLLTLSACGEDAPAEEEGAAMPTVLNQTEYVLYQNVFFNGAADDYLGKTVTKEGTYTRLYDAFSEKYRYYVWGYNDATKCCDWQWEFVPADPEGLPAVGSLVKMTGTLAQDEAALDKFWFTDASLELETAYSPADCQVDMTTMSATLERVQLLNMQYKPQAFKGQSLRIYGRVKTPGSIQNPYYDNSWEQAFETKDSVPAIGTMVIVSGTWSGDTILSAQVAGTSRY